MGRMAFVTIDERAEWWGSEDVKRRRTLMEGKERNALNKSVRVNQKLRNMVITESKVGWRWERKRNGVEP